MIITLSIMSAIAFIIILHKIGIRNFTRHSILTDIVLSGILTFLFIGTYSGMVIALGAGIFISLYLFIAKWLLGTGSKKRKE